MDEWAVIQYKLWTAVMTISAYVHSVPLDIRYFLLPPTPAQKKIIYTS